MISAGILELAQSIRFSQEMSLHISGEDGHASKIAIGLIANFSSPPTTTSNSRFISTSPCFVNAPVIMGFGEFLSTR